MSGFYEKEGQGLPPQSDKGRDGGFGYRTDLSADTHTLSDKRIFIKIKEKTCIALSYVLYYTYDKDTNI